MSFSASRVLAGLTIDDVSQEFRVPPDAVQQWEDGKATPPQHVTRALDVIGRMSKSKAAEGIKPLQPEFSATRDEGPLFKSKSLIKSKKRVADHGEVFTPPWLVEEMLNLVKGETERIDSRFLDPCTKSGVFLREVPTNGDWVDQWKVLMNAVQGTSAAIETKFLSKPIVAEPGAACTETYLVAGRFDNETEAQNYAAYLRTRFVRFLVSLRKATQHANRDVYSFVPDLPLDRQWTDAMLYERYGLNAEEVAFIESQVAEHNDARSSED